MPLLYVNSFTDARGKKRNQFRRKGFPKVTIPGTAGETLNDCSSDFRAAYTALLNGTPPPRVTAANLKTGTIERAIFEYKKTLAFRSRSKGTQTTYGYVLKHILENDGHRLAADVTPKVAQNIIWDVGEDAPGVANVLCAVMSKVYQPLFKDGLVPCNPWRGIEKFKLKEHHCWTDEELEQFERRWPVGTRERAAYDSCLYTVQRVSDAYRLGPKYLVGPLAPGSVVKGKRVGGWLDFTQQKTGTAMSIPLHERLVESIRALNARGRDSFISMQEGTADISKYAFSWLLRNAIESAGLPTRCVPHGLRKAGCRRLAENGATPSQIQFWSGHKTLKEVEHYTKAANGKKMTAQTVHLLDAVA